MALSTACKDMKVKYFALILLGIVASAAIPARAFDRAAARDSVALVLEKATTTPDSIRELLNLFDLTTDKIERYNLLESLYKTAAGARDTATMLEAIKFEANINRANGLSQDDLLQRLEAFNPSPAVKEVRLFVRMLAFEHNLDIDEQQNLTKTISSLIQSHSQNPPTDNYERLERLFRLCTYMGKATRGDMLQEYVLKADSVAETISLPVGAVRSLIYTRSAPILTNTGASAHAVRIDKKELNLIDSLARSYEERGRLFRDMSVGKYTCYRRMLANYKVLSDAEIHQYYNAILDLVKNNSNIAEDFNHNPRTRITYLMATRQYAQAIPLIYEAIELPSNKDYMLYLYNAMMEAAEHTGNVQAQYSAAINLNKQYRLQLEKRDKSRYRELQIIYMVNELRDHTNNLESEQLRSSIRTNIIIISATAAVVILLIVILLILRHRNKQSRKMAAQLRRAVEDMQHERKELLETKADLMAARDKVASADRLKTDFINNMSHEVKAPLAAITEYTQLIVDCIPDDKRPYLDKFGHIIEQNTAMVLTIMNDVLDSASLENGNMSITREPTSVQNMCQLALANVFEDGKISKKGLKILFNTTGEPDLNITTDPQRATQVLINLLKNAEKFTQDGSVTLDYAVDRQAGELTFIVTDTGIGIPRSMTEEIFERFRQLDTSAHGCGLGLYISRRIADLLGGTITVDSTYGKGARFLFTLPL